MPNLGACAIRPRSDVGKRVSVCRNLRPVWYLGSDGKYHGRVWMGYKPDGKPDRRHVERKTEPEVIKAIRELEKKRDAGLTPKPGKAPTMAKWCAYCLETVLPLKKLAPTTIASYTSDVTNWIVPELGAHRIDALRPDHLEALYAKMLAAGKADSHVRKVHAIISSFLGVAERRGTIGRNPAGLVDAPSLGDTEITALTREEARAVLAQAAKRRNAALLVGRPCARYPTVRDAGHPVALRRRHLHSLQPFGATARLVGRGSLILPSVRRRLPFRGAYLVSAPAAQVAPRL